jgi:hypothetical protein
MIKVLGCEWDCYYITSFRYVKGHHPRLCLFSPCLSASPKEELQALITNTLFVLASFCMRRSVSLDVELSLAKGELQPCTMPRYTILMEGEALLACT